MNRIIHFLLLTLVICVTAVAASTFLSGRASAHSYWLSDDDPGVCCDEHYVDCDAWELHPNPDCHHAHECDDSRILCGSTGCPGCLSSCWPFSGSCDDYDMDGIGNYDESETCSGPGCGYDPDPGDPTNPLLDLVEMGATMWVKDVFVEVDYLQAAGHSHAPDQMAIEALVQAFANAPVENINYVDGVSVWGIQLHVDVGPLYGVGAFHQVFRTVDGLPGAVGTYGDLRRLRDTTGAPIPPSATSEGGGDAIPEAGNEILDYDPPAGSGAADFYALKANYFNHDYRAPFFHYVIFGHQVRIRPEDVDLSRIRQPCTSGRAEVGCTDPVTGRPDGGNDLMVTLGGNDRNGNTCWPDTGGQPVGTMTEHLGTFMHELGHNLGLQHGGGDSINWKPNYYSVMNYLFQFPGIPAAFDPPLVAGHDCSRIQCPTLHETSLDECEGINCLPQQGASDWNGNGVLEGVTCDPPNDSNIDWNINTDAAGNGENPPVLTDLDGFEDWNNLVYAFQAACTYDDGNPGPVHDEQDPDMVGQARQLASEILGAVLVIDKTGPTSVSPGETISYNITVKNAGRGPAYETVLTDTLPDATEQTFDLGTLEVGDEEVRSVTFTVPSGPTSGRLVNQASVIYEDLLGNVKDASVSFETNRPPVCDANGPYVAECASEVQLDGSGSLDYDGDSLTYLWTGPFSGGTATGAMPLVQFSELGDFEVQLTVSDGTAEETCTANVSVRDTTPPVIETVSATPSVLSPPNHKMRSVTLTVVATDTCDAAPISRIVSVGSNEPINGLGDGDTSPDWEITGDLTVDLRAERSGTGEGRIYTVSITATDESGNSSPADLEVVVPHDKRKK